MFRFNQSFDASLAALFAVLDPAVDEPAPPPAPRWASISGIGLSRLRLTTIGSFALRPACFATSTARNRPLSALLAWPGRMNPSCAAPLSAVTAKLVTLIGSVIVFLVSSRSSRSTFLASRRRRRSVKRNMTENHDALLPGRGPHVVQLS